MIKEAIDRILELKRPETVEVRGITYWAGGELVRPPTPRPLTVATLTGLVDYFKTATDKRLFNPGLPPAVLHVVSPTKVAIIQGIGEDDVLCQRATWAIADCAEETPHSLASAAFVDLETFIIRLQATFEDGADKADVLRLLGNVTEDLAKTDIDDGITQKVIARTGVALVDEVRVKNPVKLAPFRTFTEVAQPVSPFILRIQGGAKKQAALFEADGGRWRGVAMTRIAEYLGIELPDVPVIA